MTLEVVREMFVKIMANHLGLAMFLSHFGNFPGECENTLRSEALDP